MSDFIPTDILIEILLKLPVKSLIRFTTVAKSWRSVITSRTFIDSHISGGNNHTLLLRRYDKSDKLEHYSLLKTTKDGTFRASSSSQLEFPFKSQNGYFRIVGSCDGLVCLLDDLFVNCSSPIVIWNPSVRNHIVLPNPTINPKEVPHIVALGFGGVAGDVYKVVRLVYCRKTEDFGFGFVVPPMVEIYSLGTGKWRKMIGVDVRLRVLEYMWNQAFLNGVVHWLAYEPIDDIKTTRGSILSFHMGDEAFGEVMLPEQLASESVTSFCMFVIWKSLGIVKYDGEATRQSCDVWIMKEYGVKESWIKLYRIDRLERLEKVVGFLESGEALLALMNIGLVAYNPFTMLTTDLGIDGAPRSFYVDNYSESLLLLKGHVVGAIEEESSVRRIEKLVIGMNMN